MSDQSVLYEPYEIRLPCIRVEQPMGVFFVASISSALLHEITYSDVRKLLGEREVDTYLGIQRELDSKRVQEISKYVNTVDACFPTAVILAVEGRCANYDAEQRILTLRTVPATEESPSVSRIEIAKVLDGQHRIRGLDVFKGGVFEINVSVFVDMDIANQAYMFSVVNLAQTKVKKSLVYDLFEYSRSRSPQKSAHNIAVALDQLSTGPFYKKIKRLGTATAGRAGETITQSTFVEAVMTYISKDPVVDRDLFKRGRRPSRASSTEERTVIFRNLFLDEKDERIADVLVAYFKAIRRKWPIAWDNPQDGYILARTSGFRGLMRLLGPVYLKVVNVVGDVPEPEQFLACFERSTIADSEFVRTEFLPGGGGEAELFRRLSAEVLPQGLASKR